MRWLLRHRVGGWEHFNMQLNLLMASLYNVVIVTISVYTDISPLNIHHNPVFNNQCLYLCFPSEHLLSKPHRAWERTEFTADCSVITQSFFLSFKSSFVPKPFRHFLGSLAQRFSIFSVLFPPSTCPSQKRSLCLLLTDLVSIFFSKSCNRAEVQGKFYL